MPTTRHRVLVTESDELAEALDEAARRWPGESRSALLARLALEGHRAALREHGEQRKLRRAAIEKYAGALRGVYDPASQAALRDEWPE